MAQGRSHRLTVRQTADSLGISENAVRSRLKRGTLRSDKIKGVRYVFVSEDVSPTDPPPHLPTESKDELIQVLREQLRAEREAHAETRRIAAGLVQRLPELETTPYDRGESYDDGYESNEEPPQRDESPENRYTPTEEPPEPQTDSQRPARRAPWWRRIFGS